MRHPALGSTELVPVAIVHDYLTQRGGAERVVLALLEAFPDAPVYTSLYYPTGTFPEFREVDVRPAPINNIGPLRHRHRLALPLLAATFSGVRVPARVTVCSSSGWAHGAHVAGRKVVYCYNPARWLYQSDEYLGARSRVGRLTLAALGGSLRRWDVRQARSAHRYVAISSIVRTRIAARYGVDAEVIHPPTGLTPIGPHEAVAGVEPGFILCVSRLLPYKNVDQVIDAFRVLPGERLVVVGTGPQETRLSHLRGPNVQLLGRVSDANLRWLYAQSAGIVAASYEDFGLVPVEAAAFGKPSAALAEGGFLDSVRVGLTGLMFDSPDREAIADAVRRLRARPWNRASLLDHAQGYSRARFVQRLRAIVQEEDALLQRPSPIRRFGWRAGRPARWGLDAQLVPPGELEPGEGLPRLAPRHH
jgi:glycosyltransferase involved in cell wall biosynthesis